MKQFIKQSLLFAVVVVIAYPILIVLSMWLPIPQVFKPSINYKIGSYGHMYSRLQEARNIQGDVDILFLGSSHSYRGFDPRNFEPLKTFNLGSSAQTPLQTKILLDRYLDLINPKMVVYEVYPNTLGSDGVESSLDLIANDRNDWNSVKMALEINNIKTYNTLIYGFAADLLNINKGFEEPVRHDEDTYISGGYVQRDMSYHTFEKLGKRKWKFRDEQLAKFNECLQMLKERDIETVLVFAPIAPNVYNAYTNYDTVDSLYNSYGLKYYDFNRMLDLNDSLHFYDGHHLNQDGVNIFNAKVREVLGI